MSTILWLVALHVCRPHAKHMYIVRLLINIGVHKICNGSESETWYAKLCACSCFFVTSVWGRGAEGSEHDVVPYMLCEL